MGNRQSKLSGSSRGQNTSLKMLSLTWERKVRLFVTSQTACPQNCVLNFDHFFWDQHTSFRKHQWSEQCRELCLTLNRTAQISFNLAISGMSFITPQPDTPPTSAPDSYPLGGVIHAALQSKEYLGQSGTGVETRQHNSADTSQSEQTGTLTRKWRTSASRDSAGTTTNPTQAVPGDGQAESTATVISPGLLTTALGSPSAAGQSGPRNTMSSLPMEEETTTTLITTTTITTMHVPGICKRAVLECISFLEGKYILVLMSLLLRLLPF